MYHYNKCSVESKTQSRWEIYLMIHRINQAPQKLNNVGTDIFTAVSCRLSKHINQHSVMLITLGDINNTLSC